MNHFTAFLKVYVPTAYRQLWWVIGYVLQAVFYRRDIKSGHAFLTYDHGLTWRLLRDVWVLLATAVRLVVGIVAWFSVVFGVWPLALIRAILIPLIGLWRGYRLARTMEKAERATGPGQ